MVSHLRFLLLVGLVGLLQVPTVPLSPLCVRNVAKQAWLILPRSAIDQRDYPRQRGQTLARYSPRQTDRTVGALIPLPLDPRLGVWYHNIQVEATPCPLWSVIRGRDDDTLLPPIPLYSEIPSVVLLGMSHLSVYTCGGMRRGGAWLGCNCCHETPWSSIIVVCNSKGKFLTKVTWVKMR